MRNGKTGKGYLIFLSASSISVLIIALIIVLLAVLGNTEAPIVYVTYPYDQYIDRSQDMTFTTDGGGQLYEAEAAVLSAGCTRNDNVIASGGYSVAINEKKSVMYFLIDSDSNCNAELILSICYVTDTDRDTTAENLFSIYLNNLELGMRHSVVRHCYSQYNFIENVMCEAVLTEGVNRLEVITSGYGFAIDYLVLVSSQRRETDDQVIGFPSYAFYADGQKQIYEAEYSVYDGVSAFDDAAASNSHYVRFNETNDSISFDLNCNKAAESRLVLSLKYSGNKLDLDDLLNITVNNARLRTQTEISATGQSFVDIAFGTVNLLAGVNHITVSGIGEFSLDCLIFNADINYSYLNNACKFEAEYGDFNGGCEIVEDQLFSDGAGVYLPDGGDVSFSVSSRATNRGYLSVKVKNVYGNLTSDDLAVSVNGASEPYEAVLLNGDGDYSQWYLCNIAITAGINEITLQSYGAVELDYIIISNSFLSDTSIRKYEAENAVLFGCSDEWCKTASGNKDVGYNDKGTEVAFYIYSDKQITVDLYLALSSKLIGEQYYKNYIVLQVNGQTINLEGQKYTAYNDWRRFEERFISEITLNAGLNIISFKCVSQVGAIYNLDYMRLA